MIYIGSADDDHYDQELESVEIGPLQLGTMKFQLDAACPDYKKIPEGDVLGVTAILILQETKILEWMKQKKWQCR